MWCQRCRRAVEITDPAVIAAAVRSAELARDLSWSVVKNSISANLKSECRRPSQVSDLNSQLTAASSAYPLCMENGHCLQLKRSLGCGGGCSRTGGRRFGMGGKASGVYDVGDRHKNQGDCGADLPPLLFVQT